MPELTPLQKAVRLEGWGAQRRIARAIGVHESEMSRIVNGHLVPDDPTQRAIADALGRQVEELFPQAEPLAA